MNRYIIGSLWDRNNRNGANKNFEYLFEGRKKIDELNHRADKVLRDAETINQNNINTNDRLDKIIADSGTSSTEVVDARGTHTVLSGRFEWVDERMNRISDSIGLNIDDFPRLALEVTDVARIIRALDAGSIENGATLVFNQDEYTIGSSEIELLYNNITFLGKVGGTKFKLVENVSLSNAAIKSYNKENIGFMNIIFDGNNENQVNTHHVLRLEGIKNPIIDKVQFTKIYGTALTLSKSENIYLNRLLFADITGDVGNPGEGIYGQNIKGGSINNVVGKDLGDHLIYLDSTLDGFSENIDFINVSGYFCGQNELTTGSAINICNDCRGYTFTNCHSYNSRSGFYFHENGNTGLSPSAYTLINCSANNSVFGSGFDLRGAENKAQRDIVNAKLIGCTSNGNKGSGSSRGFRIQDLEGITMTDCDASANGYQGITLMNVKRARINAPNTLDNAQLGSVPGIKVGGGVGEDSEDIIIRGGTSKGSKHSHDIVVLSGSKDVKLIGGDYRSVHMDEGTGEYIPDDNRIQIRIAANAGDGILTVISGEKYVGSLTSTATGFRITLENLPSTIKPTMFIFSESSTGFGTEGTQISAPYVRSVSNSGLEIGLKSNPTSSHFSLGTMTVGSISMTIMI